MTPQRRQTAVSSNEKNKQNELKLQIGCYLTLQTRFSLFLNTVFQFKSLIPTLENECSG